MQGTHLFEGTGDAAPGTLRNRLTPSGPGFAKASFLLFLCNDWQWLLANSHPASTPIRLPLSACRAEHFLWPPPPLWTDFCALHFLPPPQCTINTVGVSHGRAHFCVYIYLSMYRHFGTIFRRVNVCTLSRTLTFQTLGHSHMKCYTLLFTYSQKKVVLCYTWRAKNVWRRPMHDKPSGYKK